MLATSETQSINVYLGERRKCPNNYAGPFIVVRQPLHLGARAYKKKGNDVQFEISRLSAARSVANLGRRDHERRVHPLHLSARNAQPGEGPFGVFTNRGEIDPTRLAPANTKHPSLLVY